MTSDGQCAADEHQLLSSSNDNSSVVPNIAETSTAAAAALNGSSNSTATHSNNTLMTSQQPQQQQQQQLNSRKNSGNNALLLELVKKSSSTTHFDASTTHSHIYSNSSMPSPSDSLPSPHHLRSNNNNSNNINNSDRNNSYSQFPQSPSHDFFPSAPSMPGSRVVSDIYQWPVLFAILPPILTLYTGRKIEEWSEGFLLVVIAFYLYGLVKIPWELYETARIRHAHVNKVAAAYSSGQLDPSHKAEVIRQNSVWKLYTLEWIYFVMVFASPLGGAVFLRYIRPHVHLYQNLIDDFPMALYVLTAYIRPLMHLYSKMIQNAADLQEDVHYPEFDIKQRLIALENNYHDLLSLISQSKNDFKTLEPNIRGLEVRRRKEKKFFEASIQRFKDLELRLHELEIFRHNSTTTATNSHHSHLEVLPSPSHVGFLGDFTLVRLIMLPVNLGFKIATFWIPSPVKKLIEYPKSPAASHSFSSNSASISSSNESISSPNS